MKYTFPQDFIFGIGDADLQVIGEKKARQHENSCQTMWNAFSKKNESDSSTSTDPGVDRYSKWKVDIEFMKKLGITHYRTSISMSRTLNEDGSVNVKAMKWYKTYFTALQKSGIKVYATLYHWEMPQHLHLKGGWTNPASIQMYLRHIEAVVNELDPYIHEYFLFNELWCISMNSYYLGIHAPGEKSLKKALLVAHNLLLSLGLGYELIKKLNKKALVSTVSNARPTYTLNKTPENIKAAKIADGVYNRWFLDPLFKGCYPDDVMEMYGKDCPQTSPEDFKIMKVGSKLHAFGLNFYRGKYVEYSKGNRLGYVDAIKPHTLTNDLGWPITVRPIYGDCMFDMLDRFYKTYKDHGLKKIYLSENGMAQRTDWDGKEKIIQDHRRIYYLHEHIIQIHKALQYDIPVDAYFAWTLMDNFEWEHGYKPNSAFGLVHVDRKTLKRVPKKSYFWYKELIDKKFLED